MDIVKTDQMKKTYKRKGKWEELKFTKERKTAMNVKFKEWFEKKIEFLSKTKYLITIFDTSVSQENVILREYFPFKDRFLWKKTTIEFRRFKSWDPRFLKLRVRSDDLLILSQTILIEMFDKIVRYF